MTRPTEEQRRRLPRAEVAAAGLGDWRHLRGLLAARFATGDHATGLALVARIGEAAEAADHHPDLTVSYASVVVRLQSHDVQGVTRRDVDLAREVSRLAAEAGARADSDGLSMVDLGLDTARGEQQASFWATVLAAEARDGEVVGSPRGVPDVWFQHPDPAHRPAPGEVPQRWHPDVWVDPAEAPRRVQAVLAAGAALVSDAEAPAFWVLADPEGNRFCICTPADRDLGLAPVPTCRDLRPGMWDDRAIMVDVG